MSALRLPHYVTWLLCAASAICAISGSSNTDASFIHAPQSNVNNTVVFGNMRVTVHSPYLVRLEWSASAAFDDRPTLAFINRTPSANFSHSVTSNTLRLNTSALTLTYNGSARFGDNNNLAIVYHMPDGPRRWTPYGPGTVQCGTAQGQDRVDCGVVNPNAATCAAVGCCFDSNVNGTNYDQHVTHCYRPSVGGVGNLGGSLSTADCDLDGFSCIAWYKNQTNQGLISRDGWVLIDDTANPALNSTDFVSSVPWRIERPWTSDYIDWYFLGHGHDYKQALQDYTAVGGPMALMDVQGYGVWHSWYHKYTDAEYRAVVASYRNYSLPLHVAVLDMDWHTEPDSVPGCDPYGGYVWNESLFPDVTNFTSFLHDNSLKVIVNTHDVTGVDHCQGAVYEAMASALGIDASTNTTVPCQLQNATYSEALYRIILDPLINGGIDWYWTDWGKDDNVWYRCVADTQAQPMLWSNYLHGQRARATGKRGLVLTPYGGLGNHRYPQVGSGDTDVGYVTLAWEIMQTAQAANVLTPWTHDLGGFHQTAFIWPTPGLWLRWIQFGVFSPSFRTHCTHDGYCEPWAFFEAKDQVVAAFQLRNALLPYIYTASFMSTRTGVAISYPLYYEWPELPEAYNTTDEYLFGPDMLVAPIVDWEWIPKSVYLPPGDWVEWCTNSSAIQTGPVHLPPRNYTFDEIPVYVRAGAIIPMKEMADAVVPPVAPRRLVLRAFPGGGRVSSTAVYEDEGGGLGYMRGRYRLLNVTQDMRTSTSLGLTISPHTGGNGYPGEPVTRAYTVQFLLAAVATPSGATFNGIAVPRAAGPGTPPPSWWTQSIGAYSAIVVELADIQADTDVRVVVSLV